MGAMGGILSRSGQEVDPAVLATLSELQTQIGPDGEHVATDRGLACVLRPMVFHEDRCTRRPFRSPAGDLLIWNGRLDNANDLSDALELAVPNDSGVEPLIHRSLEKWGTDALRRFEGDFSLAWWQPRVRKLVLATDVWALRPVFYHLAGDRLAWASRCRALLDALSLPMELDHAFIANFVIRPRSRGVSPFARIRKVPAASFLEVDPNGIRTERYWTPDPSREIRHDRDEDYAEHFLSLLRQAVARRMDTGGPVFAELSGGYDSSSIVCLGDELVRRGEVAAPAIDTVSYVFDPASSADERAYIKPVEERLGRTGFHVTNDSAPLLSVPPSAADYRPDFPSGQLIYSRRNQVVADRMKERGARVLLRGMGGDQATWGDPGLAPWEIGDHLVRGNPGRAVRAAQAWAMALKTNLYQTFWRGGLWPLMPQILRRRSHAFALPVEGWFQKGFVEGGDLRSWTLGVRDDVGFRRPSQRQQWASIWEVSTVVGWEFLVHRGAVECRFPFLDRSLVEFVLAMPVDRMLLPGESRSLARRAMRGRMPEKVRTRRSKAGPDEVVYRTISRRWQELAPLLEDPLVSQYGFVDRERFHTTCQRVRHGVTTVAPQLTRTFALEFWLRSLGNGAGHSTQAPPRRVETTNKEVIHDL